ncbi:hypothetical protein RCL1_000314 [Eukaryota sp. TZLM3-RCL]
MGFSGKTPTFGDPVHDMDLARAFIREVDPRRIIEFIDLKLIDVWKFSGVIPFSWTENDLWRTVVLTFQFDTLIEAMNAVEDTAVNWEIPSFHARWSDYVLRFQSVVYRSTLVGRLHNRVSPSVDHLNTAYLMKIFLANTGILSIFFENSPSIQTPKYSQSLAGWIRDVGLSTSEWCKRTGSLGQQLQRRVSEPVIAAGTSYWEILPSRLRKDTEAAQLKTTRVIPTASVSTPVPRTRSESTGSTSSQGSRNATPAPGEQPEKPVKPYCPFCRVFGHVKADCPRKDCRGSRNYDPNYVHPTGARAGKRRTSGSSPTSSHGKKPKGKKAPL